MERAPHKGDGNGSSPFRATNLENIMAKKIVYGPPMTGEEVTRIRKSIGLRPKSMATFIMAQSLKEYMRWEEEGLKVPHDIEGPTTRLLQVVASNKINKKDKVDFLKALNYPGPEQKYNGVDLILPMADLIKIGDKK